MSDVAVQATLRVTVHAAAGRHDLVVTPYAPAGDLLVPVVTAALGVDAAGRSALLTRDGRVLDLTSPLADQGVRDGDLLVLVPTGTRSRRRGRARRDDAPVRTALPTATRLTALGLGSVALLGAVGLGGTSSGAGGGWVAAGVLAVVALAAVLVPTGRAGDVVRVLAPVLAGAAVVAVLDGTEPGQRLLAWCAGAVLLAVVAASGRATDRGVDEALLVETVTGTLAALVLSAVLLAGGDDRAPWALLAALVLPVVRLLPMLLVDVPDDLLLELDRLSVTAWTAHDTGRRRRRRRRLRIEDVGGTVRHSQRLYAAGIVAVAAVGAMASVLLVLLPGSGRVPDVGMLVLVGCLAVGQALAARPVRDRWSRAALRSSAAVGFVAFASAVIGAADPGNRLLLALGGVAVALVVLAVAVALRRDWRSVRWARVADGLESFAVVLSLPAGLVAAGAVEVVRQLVS